MTAQAPAARIRSIDVVRGAVMVLMAIDHVRVYSGVPAGGPTAGVFFTRWVTHFCAPAFAFFAGTSVFLSGRKLGNPRLVARHLVARGLLLVLLEFTLVRMAWTFNMDYAHFMLAGVIWMLGWCMVLLAGLVRFSPWTVGTVGLVVMGAQQVFGLLPRALPATWRQATGWLWQVVYLGGHVTIGHGGAAISVLYSIVPWIGVMAAGYAFGTIVVRDEAARRRACLRIGLSATALYLAVAAFMYFFAPADPGDAAPRIFLVLNPPKYPASQPFLLMTLGPIIAVLPLVERARGWLAGALATFGRVPLFYYLLHIPVIHVSALAVTWLREGAMHPEWYATAPYASVPEAHQWRLPLLYAVFAVDVALLYLPCRWFAGVRARHPASWLRYL